MKIGFFGAGKAGFSLGKYFSENGLSVTGYYNRNRESAAEAARFTGTKCFETPEELISASGCIFITVSDGAIKNVYNSIKSPMLSGKMLCHCSGSLSAEETFSDIESFGACSCSVHPLFPISGKHESFRELHKAYFCIEGSDYCTSVWTDIFKRLGNPVRIISAEDKTKYHAACSMMSNLVCALAQESLDLLTDCGFSEEEALSALYPLAENNLRNIFSAGPINALTGPVERNDSSTIKKHLACINDRIIRDTYISASRQLIRMAEKRHPDSDYSEMEKLLDK